MGSRHCDISLSPTLGSTHTQKKTNMCPPLATPPPRTQVTAEAVEGALRDAVFAAWRRSARSAPSTPPSPALAATHRQQPQVVGADETAATLVDTADRDGSGAAGGGAGGRDVAMVEQGDGGSGAAPGPGWGVGVCEEGWADTLRTTNLVDFFVGFLPLQVRVVCV